MRHWFRVYIKIREYLETIILYFVQPIITSRHFIYWLFFYPEIFME